MKNYYETLGVREGAGAAEIKRAYRALAIKYHPDKNPSREVEELFKEMNEAYDVLSDPQQKFLYDARRQNSFGDFVEEPVARHRDPRYRPKREVLRTKPYQLVLMEKLNPMVRVVNVVGFVLVFLFAADYFLPYQTSDEQITNAEEIRSKTHVGFIHIITVSGKNVKLYRNVVIEFGEHIKLTQTLIFGIPMMVGDVAGRTLHPMGFMYRGYIIFPVFLLTASLVGMINRKKAVIAFNFAVGTVLLVIVNYFLVF